MGGFVLFALHDRILPLTGVSGASLYRWSHATTAGLLCLAFSGPSFLLRTVIIGAFLGQIKHDIETPYYPTNGFYIQQPGPSQEEISNQRYYQLTKATTTSSRHWVLS